MIKKEQIKDQLTHLKGFENERFVELIDHFNETELCDRKNFFGHLTASGTIIHLPTLEVLLIHHKSLNKWIMPGGHIDLEDNSPVAAALREVEEETGLSANELISLNVVDHVQYCVEINSHLIPANEKKNEDTHDHHDFRFVFGYTGKKDVRIDSSEILSYGWYALDCRHVQTVINSIQLQELVFEYVCGEKNRTENYSEIISLLSKQLAQQYMQEAENYFNLDSDKAIETYQKAIQVLELADNLLELKSLLLELRNSMLEIYYPCFQEIVYNKLINVLEYLAETADENCFCHIEELAEESYRYWEWCFKRNRLDQSRLAYLKMEEASIKYGKEFLVYSSFLNIDEGLVKIYKKESALTFNEPYSASLMASYEYIADKFPGYYRYHVATYQYNRGRDAEAAEDFALSETLYSKAVDNYEQSYDDAYETPPDILKALRRLQTMYEYAHKAELSQKCCKKIIEYQKTFIDLKLYE